MRLLKIAGEAAFVRVARSSADFSVTRDAPANCLTVESGAIFLRELSALAVIILLACGASASHGYGNEEAKWGLHFAGTHDPKINTCSFVLSDCSSTSLVTESTETPGRYDLYVIALDVGAMAGTRYGICCEGSFFFYGWTSCSDVEIPTPGWPGCGGGIVQAWSGERYGPHVTIGLLDLYAYGTSKLLSACADPRTGMGQWCDGSSPTPVCIEKTNAAYFGSVGFGTQGYNPCNPRGPGQQISWGRLKSVYRQ